MTIDTKALRKELESKLTTRSRDAAIDGLAILEELEAARLSVEAAYVAGLEAAASVPPGMVLVKVDGLERLQTVVGGIACEPGDPAHKCRRCEALNLLDGMVGK